MQRQASQPARIRHLPASSDDFHRPAADWNWETDYTASARPINSRISRSRINDQAAFDFNVSLNDSSWQSTDGRVRMNYTVMEVNDEDSCGSLEIEVAPALVKKAEATRFEVVGSGAGSQRWFGLYVLSEGATSQP